MGFPTYGGGPFERWGIPTSIPLLAGFVAGCIAELLVGAVLWSESTSGLWLALALLPLELVYWIGFALPYALILGVDPDRARRGCPACAMTPTPGGSQEFPAPHPKVTSTSHVESRAIPGRDRPGPLKGDDERT